MARMSCGRRAGKLGEECDEKAAVEEGNSDGFILEVGLAIPRFDHGRAARALEQPGVQGPYARRFPVQETAVSRWGSAHRQITIVNSMYSIFLVF
jgi:hypothetical protein